MKQMKMINSGSLILVMLASLLLFSQLSMAQTPRDDKPRGPQRMIESLNISDEQKQSFSEIMKEQHEKRMDIHDQYRSSREDEHNAMKNLHQETLEKLQTVLSAEQLEKFSALAKQHRPPRHHRPARNNTKSIK